MFEDSYDEVAGEGSLEKFRARDHDSLVDVEQDAFAGDLSVGELAAG